MTKYVFVTGGVVSGLGKELNKLTHKSGRQVVYTVEADILQHLHAGPLTASAHSGYDNDTHIFLSDQCPLPGPIMVISGSSRTE